MTQQKTESPVEDSVPKINEEVAVGEDLGFQERWWRFENGAWIFFGLVLLCTVLGLLGRGPLSHGRLQNDAMTVNFERIARTGTPSLMEIVLSPAAIQNGKVQLYVSDTVIKELAAQRVVPAPAESVVGNGGITYTFPATETPASINFGLQPDGPGIYRMAVRIPGQAPLESNVYVLP